MADSVFDSNTSAGFAPLAGFAKLPQGEQLAASPAFASDFRKPFVGSGAESGDSGRNHAAVGKADEPLAGLRVAFDFVGLDFHYGDSLHPSCRGVKDNFGKF